MHNLKQTKNQVHRFRGQIGAYKSWGLGGEINGLTDFFFFFFFFFCLNKLNGRKKKKTFSDIFAIESLVHK